MFVLSRFLKRKMGWRMKKLKLLLLLSCLMLNSAACMGKGADGTKAANEAALLTEGAEETGNAEKGAEETGDEEKGAEETDNEAKGDETEAYRRFLQENYRAGIVSTLLADLTGDGRQELIVVSRNWYDGYGNALKRDDAHALELQKKEREEEERNTNPIRNTVSEYPDCSPYPGMEYVGYDSVVSTEVYALDDSENAVRLYGNDASNTHSGWSWHYLYEEDGRTYLFRYSPWAGQGYAAYGYQIFSLSEDGEEIVLYEGEENCEIRTGDAEWEETWNRMQTFLERIHAYQKAGIPLVEIGNDYFDTEYGHDDGREYNYVIDCDMLGIR